MEIKRGDIWLVSLDPIIGHEINKSRPAVIIQNDIGNKYSPITIIAPITSQKTNTIYPIDALILKQNSGIDTDSKAILNQIRAINKKRPVKKICKINETAIEKINEAIKISLCLTSYS